MPTQFLTYHQEQMKARFCAAVGKSGAELQNAIEAILAYYPEPNDVCPVIDLRNPGADLLEGIFTAVTACDNEGQPIFRQLVLQRWTGFTSGGFRWLFIRIICALTSYVDQHPESWTAVRKYVEHAEQHAKANLSVWWFGEEVWFLCRDLRFKLPDEDTIFLANLDHRWRCGFFILSQGHVLIPFSA